MAINLTSRFCFVECVVGVVGWRNPQSSSSYSVDAVNLKTQDWGVWVAHSVELLTFDFG